MGDYEKFLKIIQENLNRNGWDEEAKQRIFNRIEQKYKNSELFAPIVFSTENSETLKPFNFTRENCFGEENGFNLQPTKTWDEHLLELRRCYAESRPVFRPEEQFDNPLNEKGRFGRTLFHDAVAVCDLAKLQSLFESGADTHIVDNNGHTPLMFAKLNGMQEVVSFLQSLGINQ